MKRSPSELFVQVEEIMKDFDLSLNDFRQFRTIMSDTMARGLKKATRESSSIKMYPSYVTKVPNGTESGSYLALDLGGTNYRILAVTLTGKGVPPEIDERMYSVPASKMSGSGKELFDYIAETLASFLESHGLSNNEYRLGFTFSFPCEQRSLDKAVLVRWTKGFKASGVEQKNVAEILQESMNRYNLNVKCVAVVNDTVGTLAACALTDPKCAIGLIIGTGTNAAYVESVSNVELMDNSSDPTVIVNTEWGAFGECGELDSWRTQFDKTVDGESINPGKQLYEKMVSGMYLGEIARHILVYLTSQGLLFDGNMPESLLVKNKLSTKYLTDIERDPAHLYYNTNYMLTQDLAIPIVETSDEKIVKYVCSLVVKRAAYLAGAGISSILYKMDRPHVTIAVDGSLFRFHPTFSANMAQMIENLRPPGMKFSLRMSEDGSGKGAAAIAAAYCR